VQRNHPDVGDTAEMLADLLAERIADALLPALTAEVGRLLTEKLEDRPEPQEEGREVMSARNAAEYMDMSIAAFNKLAPELPRHRLSEARFVYLRSELLEWLRHR
jgi:hypothetical protein